ncbi:rhomboid family intramembrane serine protease [Paracoccus kondratievae]|uniref:rhomboid family intramembrane serine protease n=1 Tax=Paracoccus TaxID=265 RepID=UPI000225FD2B|nr:MULTISPECIES: rhomboid family intramembrane serine protease [Paracoccus]QFQ86756.1 rhomboid family intramembrane serine protease [Paracoccus kondratievae]SMG38054.1 Membrane associated serine protease, rhomboid family [Paracoccus sp. J56]
MRPGYDESPLNPVPAVVWVLALPMIACEAVFGLAKLGFVGGGAQGMGLAMRQLAVERVAFIPDLLVRQWQLRTFFLDESWRIVTYPFVHLSLTHALFVIVFTLALGNLIAHQFRAWAVLALFFGSAIGGALVYTLADALLPQFRFQALIGGYPAVYGFVGAFTFLLWTRLGQENANRLRAFTLIGMLLAFQLVFAILFQDGSMTWIAEIAGFGCGFLLSFVLIPGGIGRVMRQIRQR